MTTDTGADAAAEHDVHTVTVPDAGEGIAEVELVSWAVEVGDAVVRNQVVAEVMTDKATIEVPAPMDGVVSNRTGSVGEVLLVGSDLFTLSVDGPAPAGAATGPGSTGEPRSVPAPAPAPIPTPTPAASGRDAVAPRPEGRRPTASPAVRRRSREAGIDLRRVVGTGPAGRITHDDLDAVFTNGSNPQPATVATNPQPATVATTGPAERPEAGTADRSADTPIVGLRRRIAERMVTATRTIPHITYVEEVDVTELERLRATLNQRRAPDRPKLTILPFLVRAIVNEVAVRSAVNAHVIDVGDPDTPGPDGPAEQAVLRTFEAVHVGIATQTGTGLIVPVLRDAQALDLWQSAIGIAELAEATRSGRIAPADLSGSTITITSLGALGGIVTTPVINKPEVAIVGVNKIVTRPVWIDGQFVPRQIMNLSSSFDHRVIDGWDAANFVQGLRAALEQPALLFVDEGSSR